MKELAKQLPSIIWHDLKLLRFYYFDTPLLRVWNLIKHTLRPGSGSSPQNLDRMAYLRDVKDIDYGRDMPSIVRIQDRLSPRDHIDGWGFFVFRYAFDSGRRGVALDKSWATWQRRVYDHMRAHLRALPRHGRIDDIMEQLSLAIMDEEELHDFTHDDIRA